MSKNHKREIPKRRCLYYRSKFGSKRTPFIYIDIGFWPAYKTSPLIDHTKMWFEIRICGYGIDINYGRHGYKDKESKFWLGSWFWKHYL